MVAFEQADDYRDLRRLYLRAAVLLHPDKQKASSYLAATENFKHMHTAYKQAAERFAQKGDRSPAASSPAKKRQKRRKDEESPKRTKRQRNKKNEERNRRENTWGSYEDYRDELSHYDDELDGLLRDEAERNGLWSAAAIDRIHSNPKHTALIELVQSKIAGRTKFNHTGRFGLHDADSRRKHKLRYI